MNSSNKVVRHHRWLRDIALPQERASTNAFSTATQSGRTTAGRRVLAAWLPFILIARTVMCATKDERHQSEPGGKHLPADLPHCDCGASKRVRREPEQKPGTPSPPRQRAFSGCLKKTRGSWYVSLIAKPDNFEFNESYFAHPIHAQDRIQTRSAVRALPDVASSGGGAGNPGNPDGYSSIHARCSARLRATDHLPRWAAISCKRELPEHLCPAHGLTGRRTERHFYRIAQCRHSPGEREHGHARGHHVF